MNTKGTLIECFPHCHDNRFDLNHVLQVICLVPSQLVQVLPDVR